MNKQGENKIEYLNYTWSPITGCLHGCDYCYMHRMAKRFPQISMKPAFHPERLDEPKKLKKPSIIGVTFSGDMWGKWVPKDWIEKVLDMCRQAYWHRFLFLTKNPARYGEFKIPENCWCGTSITGDGSEEEEERLKSLLPWKNRTGRTFVSLEPFIGELFRHRVFFADWIIIGGLTGKGAKIPLKSFLKKIISHAKDWSIPLFIKSNAGYPEKIQEYPEDLKL